MTRFDPRVLVLVPVLMLTAACGGDDPPPVNPPSPAVTAPSSAPEPDPSESVYVEEEPSAQEPTAGAGDLPDEAQSYLDQALGVELAALEAAPKATADQKRETLNKLPDNPSQVLAALKNYEWLSPEAKALYDRAVAAS